MQVCHCVWCLLNLVRSTMKPLNTKYHSIQRNSIRHTAWGIMVCSAM